MKKSQLLDVACALTLFAMISSANAAIIASDDTTITIADQSHAQTFAVSPSSFPGVALTSNLLGDSDQTQPDEDFNYLVDGTSTESPLTDSHINLWLLLIVVSVFGILSEILHRRFSSQ